MTAEKFIIEINSIDASSMAEEVAKIEGPTNVNFLETEFGNIIKGLLRDLTDFPPEENVDKLVSIYNSQLSDAITNVNRYANLH